MVLETVGIINGCIDLAVEGPQYAEMAFNNTYDLLNQRDRLS